MRKSALLPAAVLLTCAACAPQTQPQTTAAPAPTPPPAPPAAAAPPPPPGSGPMWDVTRVTCGQLLNAADDDRDAAIMFYYGYLAAASHIRIIDVSMIDTNVRRVMDQCEANPALTIPQAYRIAFHRRLHHS
jgi:hypothetical protein